MTLQEKINSIPQIRDDEVVNAINDSNVIVCVIAICEAVKRQLRSENAKNAIVRSKTDNRKFWNQYYVSTFADAALDLLGFQKYTGTDDDIKALIKSGMDIF